MVPTEQSPEILEKCLSVGKAQGPDRVSNTKSSFCTGSRDVQVCYADMDKDVFPEVCKRHLHVDDEPILLPIGIIVDFKWRYTRGVHRASRSTFMVKWKCV